MIKATYKRKYLIGFLLIISEAKFMNTMPVYTVAGRQGQHRAVMGCSHMICKLQAERNRAMRVEWDFETSKASTAAHLLAQDHT